MRRTVSPVILCESWSEDPDDDGYLCERNFSKAPFGAEETTWATVYELTVKEIFLGSFSEEIGNIFYVRVCSPGFVDFDHRFRGRWRVELDGFSEWSNLPYFSDLTAAVGQVPASDLETYLTQ